MRFPHSCDFLWLGNLEEVLQEGVTLFRGNAFRMKLHAVDRQFAVGKAEDDAVVGLGCPKSNSSTIAISKATREVKNRPNISIPLHLRNAPTDLMKDLDYGKDYKSSHNFEDHISDQQYLPDELKNKIFYEPTELGREANIKKYLDKVKLKRKKNDKNNK